MLLPQSIIALWYQPLAMAAPLRRVLGIRLPFAGRICPIVVRDCSATLSKSIFSCVDDVDFSDDILGRSGFRVLEESVLPSFIGSGCGGSLASLGRQFQSGSALPASRTGGLMSRNGILQEGLGFYDRGYASKSKKSGGKARSDDSGGQVLVNTGPSAKDYATKQMEAAVNSLSVELSKLRTGRASPGMLDHVNVMSNGVQTPLAHVAAVSVSNLETLTVMPYDASIVKDVEKAILGSPLRLNPVTEGQTLRVPIPKLTKEHIQSMSKLVGKAGETAKLSLRRARKDAMDIIAKGGFSKDEVKRFEKEVEDVTKKYVKAVEEACKLKEKEMLGNS